jgi:hypothetical protein
MNDETPEPGTMDETPEPGMAKERITLPDGRYLIYYTFPDDDDAFPNDNVVPPQRHPEPVEG